MGGFKVAYGEGVLTRKARLTPLSLELDVTMIYEVNTMFFGHVDEIQPLIDDANEEGVYVFSADNSLSFLTSEPTFSKRRPVRSVGLLLGFVLIYFFLYFRPVFFLFLLVYLYFDFRFAFFVFLFVFFFFLFLYFRLVFFFFFFVFVYFFFVFVFVFVLLFVFFFVFFTGW